MPMREELPCRAQSRHANPTKFIAFVGLLAGDWADKSYEPKAYEDWPPPSNLPSVVALGLRHLLFLVLALAVAGAPAQARQLRHQGDEANARVDEERSQEHGRPTAFAAFINEMPHACDEQAAVLRKPLPENIVQAVRLSDDQRAALEQVRASADSAAKTLDDNCPKRIPAELGARLDTLDHALSLVADSLSGLRPSVLKFYALLDDEQKGRLVAMRVSGNPASRSSGKDSASGSGADAEAKSICTQWVANLRTWPVRQIDAGMQLSNAQRAALYELSAAIYRFGAQDCPADNPVTALGRLDARQNELQAVRRDIEAMRPSMTAFENALNDAQKKALTLSVPSRGQGSAVALPATFAAPSPLAPW